MKVEDIGPVMETLRERAARLLDEATSASGQVEALAAKWRSAGAQGEEDEISLFFSLRHNFERFEGIRHQLENTRQIIDLLTKTAGEAAKAGKDI